MIVSFLLKNQAIRRTDSNTVVAQSRNYLRAKFSALTDDWIGPITAIFNEYTVLLDANNECLVPWEVLQDPGVVNVSAFCGDLHTASVATMVVKPSGYVDGETPEPPTPGVYEQLTGLVQDAVDTANSVQQRADSGEFDGRPGEPGAAGQDGFSPIATVQQTADGATITITDKAGTTTATVKNGEPGPQGEQGPQGEPGPQGEQGPAGLNGQDAPQIDDTKITTANPWSSAKIVETVCPPFEVTGPIVTCNPVAGYPLHVVSQIVALQEGEGDPSPENVRPISGWTEANLWVGGKNLFDISKFENITETNYYLKNNGDGTLSIKTPVGDSEVSTRKTLRDFVGDLPDGNYFLTAKTTGSARIIYLTGVNVAWMFNTVRNLTSADLDSIVAFYASGQDTSAVISDIQIEPGSQASPYTPYNPASKTITLPIGQTVYGGTMDWTTGVLTVTWVGYTFTGAENWEYFSVYFLLKNLYASSPNGGKGLCSHYKYDANFFGGGMFAWPNGLVYCGMELATQYNNDVAQWKSYLVAQADAGTPVQIAYTVDTPITIQLTPKEILALSGVNTIYTDTGDTTVSGRADPTTIINQLAARIAALESAATNL